MQPSNYNEAEATQNWIKLCSFFEKGLEFNKAINSVLDIIKFNTEKWDRAKQVQPKIVGDMYGWDFYWLGALKSEAAIQFDIVNKYYDDLIAASNTKTRPPRVQLQFKTPIIRDYRGCLINAYGLNDDSSLYELEALPQEYNVSRYFRTYLDRLSIKIPCVTGTGSELMLVKTTEVLIPDPAAIDNKIYDDNNLKHKIRVVIPLPVTKTYELATDVILLHGVMFISLKRIVPDTETINRITTLTQAIKETNG